jgi:cysteine-S-conjugate beta-lyase
MNHFDFDTSIERRGTDCAKWDMFEADVLPMWVADMDFASPEAIVKAIQTRAVHGVFGYSTEPERLKAVLVERMARLYNWHISPDDLVFIPGVVAALNVAVRAYGQTGDNVLMQTPVYPPFLMIPPDHGQIANTVDLVPVRSGSQLRYEIDFDAFENAINERTKVFALCSPHNPIGRVWTREELTRMADICLKHDVIMVSDEIHCDLLMGEAQHIPLASLSPEIAARTVTLMAPSKTFNIPGLGCSFAIIQNPDLRAQFNKGRGLMVPHVNIMGFTAALAAYEEGDAWLKSLLPYLKANRDYVSDYVAEFLPGMAVTSPEGTYLSWLDCRALPEATEAVFGGWIEPFFLKHARVALNAGGVFGTAGVGFARLNFGCPRRMLTEALERMRVAVQSVEALSKS